MRGTTIGMLAFAAATAAGCGSGTHFANRPRPPSPINLTVYINDQRISVSPGSFGAGPVVLVVTNQASNAESLRVVPSSGSAAQPLADTGPISPQATAQVTVNLNTPGNYTVATAPNGSTEAAAAAPAGIHPAVLHVGKPRASASNSLLQP